MADDTMTARQRAEAVIQERLKTQFGNPSYEGEILIVERAILAAEEALRQRLVAAAGVEVEGLAKELCGAFYAIETPTVIMSQPHWWERTARHVAALIGAKVEEARIETRDAIADLLADTNWHPEASDVELAKHVRALTPADLAQPKGTKDG
jgi:hypothetical protein